MDKFFDELAETALGWLGWSEYQTLHSDMNAIVIAVRGYSAKLRAQSGISPNQPPPKNAPAVGAKPQPLTPAAFDAMFGSSKNKIVVKGRRGR